MDSTVAVCTFQQIFGLVYNVLRKLASIENISEIEDGEGGKAEFDEQAA